MFSYILCVQHAYASTPYQMPTQICTYSILSLITTATQPPPSPHTHMQRHTCRQCQAYMHVRANIHSETHANITPPPHTHTCTQASMYTRAYTCTHTPVASYIHLPWPHTYITHVLTNVLTNVSFTDELFFRWGKRPLMSAARQYAVRRHCG